MKSKINKILEKCNITEITIDKDKKYVVSIEVSNLNGDVSAQTNYIKQVIDIFTNKLNMKDCIYIPMYNGQEPFKIKEADEADEADEAIEAIETTKTTKEDINKFE